MNKEELEKIKQKALEEHIPIIMDDTLEVIEKELKENPPKRILEIGAAVGYSAMCFSEFLADGGKIDTIERDEERIKEAKINFKNVGVEEKINIYEGDAVEILPTMNDKYDVVFIDASKYCENGKNQNFLREDDINKILNAYKNRKDIDKYCHIAKLKEIEDNEYNLNIPRYVDTFEEEEPIDIHQVMAEIKQLEQERAELDKEIEKYLKELGL